MSLVTVCQLMSFLVAGSIASMIGIRNLYYIVAAVLVAIGAGGYWYAMTNRLADAVHTGVAPESVPAQSVPGESLLAEPAVQFHPVLPETGDAEWPPASLDV